jgi:hypothetical protein
VKNNYGLTPEQYHGGLDKLWAALKLTGVQDRDVFTLAAERITHLTEVLEEIAWHGTDMPGAVNKSEADWYRQVAYDCISIARRGLDEKNQTS